MKTTIVAALLAVVAKTAAHVVNQTDCAGTTYQYTGLAGYGYIASNARDKYGDTIGGIGSSIAIEQSSWRKKSRDIYSGTLYAIPDRGWYSTLVLAISGTGKLTTLSQEHQWHTQFPLAHSKVRDHAQTSPSRVGPETLQA